MTALRWFWDGRQPRLSTPDDDRMEPLTYQHVDFLTERYQRQPDGPTLDQVTELAALREQLAEDRMREALGIDRLPAPDVADTQPHDRTVTAMAWIVIAAVAVTSIAGWLVS